ncbi:MAG: LamG-like jellyroll fold domain-containing protein [Streptosporangiaceae bacterium]
MAAPQITGEPADQMVNPGDFASFSVVVAVTSGTTFQWAFNGTEIAGATGDSLLLAAVSAADAGQYSVTVTNSAGTVTSSPATLALDSGVSPPSPRLRLTAYSDTGGSVTVTPFQRDYELGEPVTLTATASAPSVFTGWSGISTGDLLATTNQVTVTMTADITVRARFAAPVPLPEGMVAFWRGETDATDLIGGHSGAFYTANNPTAPSITEWGKVGSAFAFDGTTYVQIPDASGLQPPQITLEAWVFPTALSSSYQTVIGRGSSTASIEQWWLGVLNGVPQFITQSTGLLAGTATIPLSQWTHLAVTFDGATQVLYVNGTQVASQGAPVAFTYAPVPVCIGATLQNTGPSYLFTGLIDEVSLYDRALSHDEVSAIYDADIAGKNATAPYFTTDSPLPTAAVNGTGYTQQLTTVLGTPPITFAPSAGALPPGMTLSPAGEVSGGSGVPGVFDVTVAATDASGNSTEQLYVLAIASPLAPPPGLVSWWRGEPTASVIVLDSIDGNNGGFFTGTTAASPSYTPAGEVGGAFAFDRTTYVQIPDAPGLRPAQLTLEMWVSPTVLSSSFQAVIGRGYATGTTVTWSLGVLNGVPQFVSQSTVLAGTAAIPLSQWTHLAVTFDGATQVLFVNGIQVASQGGLGALVYDPAPVPVTIGAAWQNAGPAELFTGLIDEVSLYGRALTPTEIGAIVAVGPAGKSTVGPYITTEPLLPAAIVGQAYTQAFTSVRGTPPVSYTLPEGSTAPPGLTLTPAGVLSGTPTAAGAFVFTVIATDAAAMSGEQPCTLQAYQSVPAPAGLIGWWKAEGNALDSAGDNNGVLQGGAGYAPGEVGQAFSLDGSTGCVEIPDAAAVELTSLTLEAWVLFDSTSGLSTVFAKPVGSGPYDSYSLWLTSGTLNGILSDVTGFGAQLSATAPLTTGTWYHVAYTVDDGVGQQALYVNGVQVASGATTLSAGYDTQPLLLGRDTENGAPNYFLQGLIDEASIYNRALTPAEIVSIYNAGPAGKAPVAAPVVTGVSPASGTVAGGDTVTVTGSGFTNATGVSFGTVAATHLAVAGDTELTVSSPAAAASGAVDVTVTTPAGISATSAADQFTYGNG